MNARISMVLLLSMACSVALLTGCAARSLTPVVAEGETERIQELVGVWREAETDEWPPADPGSVELGSTLIEIAPSETGRAHAVTVTDADGAQNGPDRFELALLRSDRGIVGHATIGAQQRELIPESVEGFVVQVYYPILVQLSSDQQWMAVTLIDEEALVSSMDAGDAPIACVRAGDDVLINAEPSAIRSFLLTMPEEFRDGPLIYRREAREAMDQR